MRVLEVFQTLNIMDIVIYCIYLILALVQLGNASFPGKKSYDGVKVFRIDLGDDPQGVVAIKGLIANLDLATWTTSIVKNTHVDLEVPGEKLNTFRKAVDGHFKVSVMHEDLGASILAENDNPNRQGGHFFFFPFIYYFFFSAFLF